MQTAFHKKSDEHRGRNVFSVHFESKMFSLRLPAPDLNQISEGAKGHFAHYTLGFPAQTVTLVSVSFRSPHTHTVAQTHLACFNHTTAHAFTNFKMKNEKVCVLERKRNFVFCLMSKAVGSFLLC